MIQALLSLIDRICRLGAYLAAFLLFTLFALGLAEIILRSFFATSLPIVTEYSGYLVAMVFFLGSGWTLSGGGHIRVSLLRDRFGPENARRLDLATSIIALALSAFMAFALASWAIGTGARGVVSFFPSATPLWIPQALFALGPAILTLAFLARIIRLIHKQEPEPEKTGTEI